MKQGQCPLGFDFEGGFENYSSMDIQMDIQMELELQEAERARKEEWVRWAQTEKVQQFHPWLEYNCRSRWTNDFQSQL